MQQKQTDFGPTVTKVTSASPDAVFYAGYYPEGGLLCKQLRQAGFNGRTGVACFDNPGEQAVDWQPVAPDLRMQGKILCLFDAGQIDPRAPSN